MDDDTWNCIFGGVIFGLIVLAGIINATFEESLVGGIILVSVLGFFVLLAVMVTVVILLQNKNDALKDRIAKTEEMLSSPEYKESVRKMLAMATVERHYPDWFVDIKPMNNDDVCGLQIMDSMPAAQDIPGEDEQSAGPGDGTYDSTKERKPAAELFGAVEERYARRIQS